MFIAAIVRFIINLVRKNQNGSSGQNSPRAQSRLPKEGY